MSDKPGIVVVDDDPAMLNALTVALETGGYRVVAVAEALTAAKAVEESIRKIDLVITDVSMPGMSGTALLAALKTAFPSLPVIVITAFGDRGEYAHVLADGACDYLNKPFNKSELFAAVRRALQVGR